MGYSRNDKNAEEEMDTLKEFFDRMHHVDFHYVVLRNWDHLPNDVCLGEHSDLDIYVYDFEHFREVFPTATPEFPYPRVRMKVPIGDSFFYCDVRHIGDGYYPDDFGRAMLVSREWNQNGFWTPDPVHHRLALAYHIVHHKNMISPNYRRYVGLATVEELLEAIKESSVGWCDPKDPTVGRFNLYWRGITSVVEKRDGRVFKRQNGYMGRPLLQNEWAILSILHSKHFPKVYSIRNGVLEMDDCGVSLLSDIPTNWKEQLEEILEDLTLSEVTHRDIRLDNLLVKDGIIKLIDFGWAKFNDQEEENPPPSCLGLPNKASTGWDDSYSIRSVSKQIEYHLEEKK
jgi:hypothetical protein